MPSPRIISFRIAPEKVDELDRIAKALDRDRSYLLNEAVESYLSEQRRFAAMVEEGQEASRKGELLDDHEVGALIDSWIKKRASRSKRERIVHGETVLKQA
jgi:predicted transcriptional regulator